MNSSPNATYGGTGYSSAQYSLSIGQPQQPPSTLPYLEHQLSPGIVGAPIASGSPLSSFQLASVATSPLPGTPSPTTTVGAGLGGSGSLIFNQSIVSPGALSSSNTAYDYPNYNYQPQPMPKLANVPVTQSYSYQPSTHSAQQFPNVLLNGGPISALPIEERHGQVPPQENAGIQKPKPRAPRNKSKFKRFRNAYIYFVNDQRDKVDAETKKLKNKEFLQLMSARWKTMSEDQRKPYIHLAEEDKKRFNEDVKRYGKYESRKRRYNRPQPLTKSNKYTYPQGIYNSGGAASSAATAAADFMYTAGGYGSVVPAPQTNISQFYAGPSAQNSANARLSTLAANNLPHPGTTVLPAEIQQQLQQSSALLTPPAAADAQRKSVSSNNSSAVNDIGDLSTSLSPGYQWAAAAAAAAAAGDAQAGMIPHGRYYAAYYPQQQQPVSYLQAPTGAPITHSLTEPAFQLANQQNPLLAQNQQQTQPHMLRQHQY
ncbi:hypothetical protein LPJ59_003379 [Coemansia sp. RSA 2399]|nr:hypothetical protein LPJ59_003379 [Coemansia sp. RSA 2399]